MSLYPWNRSIFYQIEFSEGSSYAFGFLSAGSGPDMIYDLHRMKYNIRHTHTSSYIRTYLLIIQEN